MAPVVRLSCWLVALTCVTSAAHAQIIFGGSSQPRQPPRPRPVSYGDSCPLPGNRWGTCGRAQDCPSLLVHLKNRNVAFLKSLVCGSLHGMTLLCCPDGAAPPVTTAAPLPTPDPSPEACGISKGYVPMRVVGGEPVQAVGTFAWLALLEYSSGEKYQCGASVLNRRWLLTAAHCVNVEGGPVSVRVGELDYTKETDNSFLHPPQDIEIEQLIRHKDYSRTFHGFFNDVALIKLKRDVKFSDIVRPICLPTKRSATPQKGKVVVAGWGLREFGDQKGTHDMQYADINITDVHQCKKAYFAARQYVIDPEQHLCASGNITAKGKLNPGCQLGDTSTDCQGGVDTCRGDSGGPLMSYEKLRGAVRFTATGVVSFALGCGSARYPGIYTRVDNYLDWIHDTMAFHGDL